MGRPRSFDEDTILEAAAAVFVRGGYEGTSIDDLVRTLGLHRGSLYQRNLSTLLGHVLSSIIESGWFPALVG